MSRMVCVYGNPTVDYVHSRGGLARRYGGGVYYSTMALLDEGVQPEIYSVGPHWLFMANKLWFFKANSSYSASPTVFKIAYLDSSRVMEVLELSPELTSGDTHPGVCYTIVNPVLGEVSFSLLKELRVKSVLLAGDIQGFVRERRPGLLRYKGGGLLIDVIGLFDILHMDVEEAIALTEAESKHGALQRLRGLVKESLVVVTEGVKPPILVTGGSVSEVGSERSRVDDKTGAGDYFLGKLFLRMIEGMEPREAVESALEETDQWLTRGEDKLLHRGVSPFSNSY